jgi:DNA-binding CsgD family transcriptional regulator
MNTQLTPRQSEILTLIQGGKTNLEIARAVGLSEKTVKAHATAIFRALGVRNRTEAALSPLPLPLLREDKKGTDRPFYLQLFLSRHGVFQLRYASGAQGIWISLFSLNADQADEMNAFGWPVVREPSTILTQGNGEME